MKTIVTIGAIAAIAGAANAQSFSVVTNETNTVRDDGPTGQPFFHNAQGSGNGSFASFAASDYDASGIANGSQIVDLDTLTFSIQQANAGFTTDGPIDFYVADAGNAMSTLAYGGDDLLSNPGGLVNVALVGSGQFVEQSSGFQNDFMFDFDGSLDGSAAEALIESAILNGTELRWAIAAGSSTTSATFGGIDNFDTTINPTISGEFTIPTPGAAALMGIAGVAGLRRRRA